jgi:hypothetical protein
MQLDYDMVTSGGLNLIKLKPESEDAKLKIDSDQYFVLFFLGTNSCNYQNYDLGD